MSVNQYIEMFPTIVMLLAAVIVSVHALHRAHRANKNLQEAIDANNRVMNEIVEMNRKTMEKMDRELQEREGGNGC